VFPPRFTDRSSRRPGINGFIRRKLEAEQKAHSAAAPVLSQVNADAVSAPAAYIQAADHANRTPQLRKRC
jgi:hypothetical protein